MTKQIAPDRKVEQEIQEVEEFWARKAPEKYKSWAWVKMPGKLAGELESYHRVAALKLKAPLVDWDSGLASLGVDGAIDGHSHLEGYPENPEIVEELARILDNAGIRYIVNLPLAKFGDDFIREVEEGWLKGPLAGRVINFTTFDWQLDSPGFVKESCAFLDRVRAIGVRGLKVHKNVGTSVYAKGKVARLTDTRFKEIFSHAGELGMPVWIHYGDPYCFFQPLGGNPRERELTSFPDWHFYTKNFHEKNFWQLQEDFFRLVEDTPQTNFNAVHLANYPWNRIDEFAGLLLRYPNLYTDVSARMSAIGKGRTIRTRERRAWKTKEIITRCQDKIIWGTDILPTEKLYKLWSLFLRSDLEDIDYTWATFYPGQGDWLVDGLNLDSPVMEKLCRDVARGLLGL
jgi:predicted TIM-barrel fold metal-dependent hydrolase